MSYDPDTHHRRSIRLPMYDYSRPGAYFVTICTYHRELLFEDGALKKILEETWKALPERFPDISPDEFIIMPNHIHFSVQPDDEMNMIRHDDELIRRDVGEALWKCLPRLFQDLLQSSVFEQQLAVIRADGYEIRPGPRIIVHRQTDRATVVGVGVVRHRVNNGTRTRVDSRAKCHSPASWAPA